MASITQTWNNATPAGTDAVSAGDDRIREAKTATRERLQNAGLYHPDVSADSDSGVPFISPDAKVANEWNIFDKTGGNVPDVARKLFSLTQTGLTLHSAVTVNAAGTLQQAGSNVITRAGTKRTVVFQVTGDVDESVKGDRRIQLFENLIYIPQTNSGGGAITGVLREFVVICQSLPSQDLTFDLRRAALGSAWSSDTLAALGTTSLLATALSITDASNVLGARHDDEADFAGAAFPVLNGGDVLQVVPGANTETLFATAFVTVDFNWPA